MNCEVIAVGTELLLGQIVDTNSSWIGEQLALAGIDSHYQTKVGDNLERMTAVLTQALARSDAVIMCGGLGPTHDDLTMDGVAGAFGLETELSQSIAARIERAQGRPPNKSQLKMATIPKGARLVDAGDLWFPVVIVENVHIFPGIPELLRKKFESIRERFRGVPVLLKRVYVRKRESEIAEDLHELLKEFPELMLGSYPRIGEERFHVLLTLESRDAGYLQRALDSLLGRLEHDAVHKVE